MKILHLSTYDSSGAGLAAVRLHNQLLSKNIDSKVLCLYHRKKNKGVYQYEIPLLESIKVFVFRLTRKMNLELSKSSKFDKRISKIIGHDFVYYTFPFSNYDLAAHPFVKEAEIIHLHYVANFLDYESFFRQIKKPIIWTVHDEGLYYGIFHHRRVLESYYKRLKAVEDTCKKVKQKALAKVADLTIVSLSSKMLHLSKSQEISKDKKHVVIHNSVNTDIFYPTNKLEARKHFRIAAEKKVIFFVCDGINDPNKGIKTLLMAVEILKMDDIIVVAAGGDKLNFPTKVDIHFLGYINEEKNLALAYSMADLFVLPSFQEAFAQTPLEAMSCGIPVVMFPCSGSNDLITEENGIIAREFTAEALMDAIKTALQWKYDAKKIRQTILHKFTPEIIGNQYIDLYKNILKCDSQH